MKQTNAVMLCNLAHGHRKAMAILLCFALLLGTLGITPAPEAQAATDSADFDYYYNEDGTVTIAKCNITNSQEIIVPYAINGHVVTAIGGEFANTTLTGAFQSFWNSDPVNIYLPDTITTFGNSAFSGNHIHHIYHYSVDNTMTGTLIPGTIPEGSIITVSTGGAIDVPAATVTVCTSGAVEAPAAEILSAELGFPASLQIIGDKCFSGSQLEECILTNNITYIGDNAFDGASVKDITIPAGANVTYMGTGLCNNSLYNVTIDGHVDVIAERAFRYAFDKNNSVNTFKVTTGGSIGAIGKSCFDAAEVHDVRLEGRVDSIGDSAFSGGCKIRTFYATNVGSIGSYAFSTSNDMESFIIDGSISSIGDHAFYSGCGVKEAKINSSTPYTIGASAFQNCSIEKVTFSDGLTVLEKEMFSGSNGLTTVLLPSTLEKIEANTFSGLNNVTTITIPTNTKVDANAFQGAGGSTIGALDRLDNPDIKNIVNTVLNRKDEPPKKVTPPKVTVSKVKLKKAKATNKKKKKATLKWTKNKTATGYVIYVKIVKKGKKAKKVAWKQYKVINKNKVKATVKITKKMRKTLKKKGKVFFMVKAYRKVTQNGKTYTFYSPASKAKKLK